MDEECFSLHVEEVDGEVWMMFSPTNWATKMAKLSGERTLGLNPGVKNSRREPGDLKKSSNLGGLG